MLKTILRGEMSLHSTEEEVNALAKAILSGADGDRDSKMRQFGIPKL